MQAVILAAGMGKRLKELTKNNTKCMVEVNGEKLIDRVLRQLDKQNLSKIVLVVGYEGQKLIDHISTLSDIKTKIEFIDNPIYDKTNNIYSLWLAKDELLSDDTLLLESDLIFEDKVLENLINDPCDTIALVDKYESWMDGTCVMIDEDKHITRFISGKELNYDKTDKYYKTVNIYKFSKEFSKTHYVPFLEAYSKALGNNEYYEQVLKVISILDNKSIEAKPLNGEKWYEIDDVQDLDIAESMFASDEERNKKMASRYGGYWRYPKILDFCYLVNPYYPSKHMIEEMKASFEVLLREYPSGMRVNSLLASKNFGVKEEYISIGNGAAELIKSVMQQQLGITGFIRPTFEEYPNRYSEENSVNMIPDNNDYSYDENDVIEFFSNNKVNNLVVVNPDNPSGNYIKKEGLLKLINWTKENNINLLIDESFSDFAEEENNTLLDNEILGNNEHLIVVKSISKSYGIPGCRLGIMASGNKELIANVKKDVAIWNINSFGEFYLQIAEKYKSDYQKGLKLLREERNRYIKELEKIKGLRVIPSQANYVMVELTNGMKANSLTESLLAHHNILIKDLSKKVNKEYIRLAVRDTEDNDILIKALKEELDNA